jgi:hypothetical protein
MDRYDDRLEADPGGVLEGDDWDRGSGIGSMASDGTLYVHPAPRPLCNGLTTRSSMTTSLSPSTMDFRHENGRRYHAFRDGSQCYTRMMVCCRD